MPKPLFQGVCASTITPFDADGNFVEGVYRDFVEWQIAEGTEGLVPVGTTGESPTLTHDEHRAVVRACVDGPVFRSSRVDWKALS